MNGHGQIAVYRSPKKNRAMITAYVDYYSAGPQARLSDLGMSIKIVQDNDVRRCEQPDLYVHISDKRDYRRQPVAGIVDVPMSALRVKRT